ncbi:hypothetical protein M422DRAFT_240793 [Sphaerobolus stellatus SS14]|nr:hypothetical protein M422DRAFT_240793 [Sphaerobolus stellatus SS14]
MGRTKTKKLLQKSTTATKAEASTSPAKASPSIQSIYEKAQELVVQCNYDLAHKFLLRVLEQDANHTAARELLGEVQLEMGELDAAKQTFESLLPGSAFPPSIPSSNAHLNLAQLSDEPKEALQHYQCAVDTLLGQLKGREKAVGEDTEQEAEIRAKAVSAIVAMIEIWMSDLCFEPEAEQTCETLADLALKTDPTSSEALQTLASIRMSQKRSDEAQQCAERAWESWKDLDPESPKLPPLPARLSLSRLFLELAMYGNALTIIAGIIALDDEEVEAWYLEGWCFYLMAEQVKETNQPIEGLGWEELARDALDCLETCQTLHQTQDHLDEQILQHAKEIIGELRAAGVEPNPVEEEVVTEGDEDEWVDDEGDVEMDE